jgi:class 3 adenylate cyclase/tetratricopeptide (TPR) repeat protein
MESRMFGPGESPRPSTSEGTTEERKIVSVLFADLVDFTAYSDEADPEDVRALLRPYHAAAKHEIDAHGGRVEKFVGDAVMGIFGAPTAHEDDAERAVRAAVAILERVDELNRVHPELGLAVRAAVATGEVIVDLRAEAERGESVLAGDVVNTAARLQAAATPGSVIVGERTYIATREAVEYEELGALSVKGKADPVPSWRAHRVGAALRAPAEAVTPFVGRSGDLGLLEQTFARSLRESSVQLLTVVGEPGIGKTRLIAEFRRRLEGGPDPVTWRRGRCLPYGEGVTFWALGEIVKAEAGILESDGPSNARRKLGATLAQVVREASEREWLARHIAPLVGAQEADDVGAEERAESAFAAWTRLLEALAGARPLVLVIEDIHWADDPLLSFLEHLIDWAADVPLLVTCTARPDLYERRPGWGGGKRNSATIALSPLTGEQTSELLDALLAETELPQETRAALLERAGGNPLYTEQFVRMLVDQGIIELGRSIRSDMPIRVPETVQAVISARLDTLTREQKTVLQDAAVVGKVFWTGALAFMSRRAPEETEDLLHELARKELVRRVRTSSVTEQLEYAFGHVLVRDVTYGQIPRAPRAQRHRAAAAWIERLAGERVIDHAEVLAHHYVQALDLTRAAGDARATGELEDSACRFLVLAGDRALQVDVDRADAYYHQALELLTPDHPMRPRILAKLAEGARLAGRMPEAERLYVDAIPALRGQGDARAVGETMIGLVQVLRDRGKTQSARDLLAEATALLEEEETPGRELALAYLHAARDASVSGRAREAIPAAEKAIELGRRLGLDHHVARALQFRGIPRLDLGDVGGLSDMEESLQICNGLGLGYYTANAYGNLADALLRVEGPERALELYREGIAFADGRGLTFKARWIEAETVWPLYDLGRWDELLEIADRLVEWDAAYGQSQVSLIALSYKTYVMAQRGELREARALHEEVLARARESGDEQVLAPSLTVAAVISNTVGDYEAALGYIRDYRAMGEGGYWPMTLGDAVRVATAARDLRLAESLLREAAALTPRGEHMLVTGQAVFAEAQADFERSLEHYQRAHAAWAGFGNVVESAHALAGIGRCLVARGRESEARDCLNEAREAFAALRAQPRLADIEAALSSSAPNTISESGNSRWSER